MGLESAIDFHLEPGAERVLGRARDLTRRFRAGLAALPGVEALYPDEEERSSPMTTLALSEAGNAELFAALRELGYTTKEVHDAYLPSPINAIRVCTHVFNSEEQVDGLLAALWQALSRLTAA